jgi:hypothetical protein
VWGCEEGESSQAVLCRGLRTKVNFAAPLSKSVASVASRPIPVSLGETLPSTYTPDSSGTRSTSVGNGKHRGTEDFLGRQGLGGAEKGAAVCRFAIDLTTKRASLTFPQSSPMQAPLPIPPTGQSNGPPGGYRDQRPSGAPTPGPRVPRPASRRPPAVPVQKGATDNQRIVSANRIPTAPPPVRQLPPNGDHITRTAASPRRRPPPSARPRIRHRRARPGSVRHGENKRTDRVIHVCRSSAPAGADSRG